LEIRRIEISWVSFQGSASAGPFLFWGIRVQKKKVKKERRLEQVDALLSVMGDKLKDSNDKVSWSDFVRLWNLREEIEKETAVTGTIKVSWKDAERVQ
jgi:hypothetical protein